jgi:hypothetical protein
MGISMETDRRTELVAFSLVLEVHTTSVLAFSPHLIAAQFNLALHASHHERICAHVADRDMPKKDKKKTVAHKERVAQKVPSPDSLSC